MILFLDSGVGGAIYLEHFHATEPGHACIYLADTAGFPYGEQSPDWVRDRVVNLVKQVRTQYDLQAIVLACNTASVVALDALRAESRVPVVGTVPAVKPAAARTRSGIIAILATNRTAADPYTDGLVEQFARFARVQRLGLPSLVRVAEEARCSGDTTPVRAVIDRDVRDRLDPGVDTVVLACTHFVRFRDLIQQRLGPGVAIVDSLDGVVRRVVDVALPAANTESGITWLHTGGPFAACPADPRPWARLFEGGLR